MDEREQKPECRQKSLFASIRRSSVQYVAGKCCITFTVYFQRWTKPLTVPKGWWIHKVSKEGQYSWSVSFNWNNYVPKIWGHITARYRCTKPYFTYINLRLIYWYQTRKVRNLNKPVHKMSPISGIHSSTWIHLCQFQIPTGST